MRKLIYNTNNLLDYTIRRLLSKSDLNRVKCQRRGFFTLLKSEMSNYGPCTLFHITSPPNSATVYHKVHLWGKGGGGVQGLSLIVLYGCPLKFFRRIIHNFQKFPPCK